MKYKTGLAGDLVDQRDYDVESLLGGAQEGLPSSVDLSGVADVKNQGSCGSCTAHAATICHEILNNKDNKEKIELDAQYLFKTYQVPTGAACDHGDYLVNAVKQIVAHGSMSIWGKVYKTNGFARIYDKRPNALKTYLAKGFPIMFGMNVMTNDSIATGTTALQAIWDSKTGKWKHNPTSGGHAICIVGYNDETQEFKIQNSWGSNYGDNGFVYVPYDKMTRYVYNSTYVIYDEKDLNMICADVSDNAWYSDAVKFVIEKGYMTVNSQNRFRPGEYTQEVAQKSTRAEVAQILYNLHKLWKL